MKKFYVIITGNDIFKARVEVEAPNMARALIAAERWLESYSNLTIEQLRITTITEAPER